MAFQPCPGVVALAFRQTMSGEFTENVLHVATAMGTIPPPADLPILAANAWDWWRDHMAPTIGNNVVLNQVIATDLSTEGGPQAVHSDTPIVGAISGVKLPNNCSLAVKGSTGLSGRSNRGRWFMQGLVETMLGSDNRINSTQIGLWVAALDNALTSIPTGTTAAFAVVVLSRYHAKVKRLVGVGTAIIAWTFVDDVVDSQRRRLPGHNRHRR